MQFRFHAKRLSRSQLSPPAKIGPLRMSASLARIQGDPTERERLVQRLAQVRGRQEQAYVDKLDGKITEEF